MYKTWTVDGTMYTDIDEICDRVFDPDNYEDSDAFDEWLDEYYSSITIEGNTYVASEILYNVNEDNYHEALYDYAHRCADDDRENRSYEIEDMDDGDNICINGYDITCEFVYEEDDEEDEEDVDDDEYELSPEEKQTIDEIAKAAAAREEEFFCVFQKYMS